MADVRALLRQQRAARRIEHPHAGYSDAGKLLCTVCHEHIKAETLWEGHLRSAGHRQRLQTLSQTSAAAKKDGNTSSYAGFVDQSISSSNGTRSTAVSSTSKAKRKHGNDSDEEMGDSNGLDEEAARRKRSRPDEEGTKKDEQPYRAKPLTPPLTRRTSGTPTFGVEMQIPSRPATPSASREERNNSASGSSGTPMSITPKPSGSFTQPPPTQISDETIKPPTAKPSAVAATPVDDDVWAEFEADLVQEKPKPAAVAALQNADSDAVISAPVMSAAELAAKSEEEEKQKRRAQADIQLEDEKEDATRALETEFEVMEELEARAKRLREQREALRLQRAAADNKDKKMEAAAGKENAAVREVNMDDDEDDEDEDEDDDWDGFRFRA
ncbi:hypothetical protein QBC35DRAFT_46215 [Podospora australis]|uniref:Coiled-coil domain-containing protein 16 n=1 Tax=Podospora australis TaxID=1536484 RepID=A0AAN6WQQ6_9PEZI|nr:hypothetical protein QBC35DRAFT_46215 [Podospora australis]